LFIGAFEMSFIH